jgi:hypothetical protein
MGRAITSVRRQLVDGSPNINRRDYRRCRRSKQMPIPAPANNVFTKSALPALATLLRRQLRGRLAAQLSLPRRYP